MLPALWAWVIAVQFMFTGGAAYCGWLFIARPLLCEGKLPWGGMFMLAWSALKADSYPQLPSYMIMEICKHVGVEGDQAWGELPRPYSPASCLDTCPETLRDNAWWRTSTSLPDARSNGCRNRTFWSEVSIVRSNSCSEVTRSQVSDQEHPVS